MLAYVKPIQLQVQLQMMGFSQAQLQVQLRIMVPARNNCKHKLRMLGYS